MDTMKNSRSILFFGAILCLELSSCQIRHPTATIHDDPSRFVRLEVDHTVGSNHSHPVEMTTDEMRAVLAGMIIDEPHLFPSLRSRVEEPPRHSAFNTGEIDFFAPLLAKGLRTATPEEIVTFYQATQQTPIIKMVTSGGMFVDDDGLHVILGNYRSSTHYAPDPGIGDTADGRSAPLQPIAPQAARLDFEPSTAVIPLQKSLWSTWFRPNRREILISLKNLSSKSSESSDGEYKPN
jgi:hypothetical protein